MAAVRVPGREFEIMPQNPGLVFRAEFFVLGKVRLHDPQLYALDIAWSCHRKAKRAVGVDGGKGESGGERWLGKPKDGPLEAEFPAGGCRSGKNQDSDNR